MSILLNIRKLLGLTQVYPDFGIYYIKQRKQGEDALACVAMLLNYHGQNVSFSVFKNKYSHFRNISSINKLKELCDLNGLHMQYFDGNFIEIKNVDLPCIIRWRMNRYAVLLKVNHETFYVFDPACKRYSYHQYEVECYYCESALVVCSQE
ncbi:cysteine peptidase family C39 domain-containing protein [Teredinibacter haidensis]|uniref:cysteine peptidase family C39 domain-containing protein n=1 Tax=Teredinibacter haidensis TaxID=2731755 RepID=UPI000948963D|nr:cysteine peptidase family C39 domain-containing protein [Teredinibacter haidensis]